MSDEVSGIVFELIEEILHKLDESESENEEEECESEDLDEEGIESNDTDDDVLLQHPTPDNEDDQMIQIGGARVKVFKVRHEEGPDGFKDAIRFVKIRLQLPLSMTTDPDGAYLFGEMLTDMIKENYRPSSTNTETRVGITINSPELDAGETIGLSLTPINMVNAKKIEDSLARLSQSEKSPLTIQDRKMEIVLKFITPPTGSGKRPFTMEDILNKNLFTKRRRQVDEDEIAGMDVDDFFDDEAENGETSEEEGDEEEDVTPSTRGSKINRSNIMNNDVEIDCLPYALHQVWMYVEKNSAPTLARREYCRKMFEASVKISRSKPNSHRQVTKAVRDMKKTAGITKIRDFGFVDIEKFQNTVFAGKYQIIVIVKDQKTPYFAGPYVGPNKSLAVYLDSSKNDGHYSGVRSLPVLLNTKYYCALCDARCGSFATHYSCPLRHRDCGSLDCQPTSKDLEYCCIKCTKLFRSMSCLENHLKKGPKKGKSRCDLTKLCKKCGEIYYENKTKVGAKHDCGTKWCGRCLMRRPETHHCVMKVSKKEEKKLSRKRIYYDFESREDEETGEQVPVLFIALKCCSECCSTIPENLEAAIEETCENCSPDGRGKRIDCISDDSRFLDVAEEATEWLFSSQHRKFVAIAHNNSGYDAQFILRSLIKSNKAAPTVVSAGTKIIYLKHKGVKVIDSLKYLTMSLSSIGKAFNTKMEKGDFPIKFIKPENFDYEGPIPDDEFYNLDYKTPDVKKKLLEFLEEERSAGKIFNFQEELLKYCYSDVFILASALTTFEQDFEKVTNVCLFEESCTAASAAMKVFQRNHLNFMNPIVLDARPSVSIKSSIVSQKYLAWFGVSEDVQVDISTTYGEKKICGHRVDGFVDPCPKFPRGLVIEFQGCYWHAHDCKYSEQTVISNRTAKEIRKIDAEKKAMMEQLHDVKIVWECEVEAERRADARMAAFFEDYEPRGILQCEKALVGGRTEVFKLRETAENKTIKYGDFRSLYPAVMKQEEYPIGPPTNVSKHSIKVPMTKPTDIGFRGFLSCRVLAPRKLNLPILPVKHAKLVFGLCGKCTKAESQTSCQHSDDERQFNGTFTTAELEKALECGYIITKVYHGIEYKDWASNKNGGNGGLFSSYINQMMVEKVYASGWPEEVKTDEQKKEFVKFSKESEGIDVSDWTKFVKSPGRRQVAKLLLNSLWGKLAQKVDRTTTQIIPTPMHFWKIFYDSSRIIEDVWLINDTVMIRHRKQVEKLESLKTAAVHIAAYVTSYGRLRLYKVMEMVGPKNVLYTDTDSIIYTVPSGCVDPLRSEYGPNLGEMTNELEGVMTEFYTLGPKTYTYKEVVNGVEKFIRKTKGISINSAADKKITFETMRSMVNEVLNKDPTRSVLKVPQQTVRRDRGHQVYFKNHEKQFRFTFNKRRILPDGSTLPFGFCD